MKYLCKIAGCLFAVLLLGLCSVSAARFKTLPGHVPDIVAKLTPKGSLNSTNQLHLAIGLPLRDQPALTIFLQNLYDPNSPDFHKFLSLAQFADRFGPTPADYTAVQEFARSNGLTIVATHDNRLLLDVRGPVAAIQKAFHLTLHTYRHPTENRDFFAPDTGPVIDAALPITDISGLDNFMRPRPKIHPMTQGRAAPRGGSGIGGTYFGDDFRAAYVPGTALTGAGQIVGLFEFDGFYQSDITAYENAAGITNIPIQPILLDEVSGVPGFSEVQYGSDEVSLDIEMAIAMAPSLSKVLVFEGEDQNDILEAMVSNYQVDQFSCSWGWGGGPSTTTDAIFQEMDAQGQSFFCASGDSDAFTVGTNSVNGVDNPNLPDVPDSCPFITLVGGTSLSTTGPDGARTGETVWNQGNGSGSSGGVSSFYGIPWYQTNTSMSANGGSTTNRNIPDVAMAAENILVYSENGSQNNFGGTSCAAPLWAGFTALVNQQNVSTGGAPVGFLNPILYGFIQPVTKESFYSQYFYDVTVGNNESPNSLSQYVAVGGYDLCTGLGTPSGTNLINALATLDDPLHVLPVGTFAASGVPHGPILNGTMTYTINNTGTNTLNWALVGVPPWLTVSAINGSVPGLAQDSISVSVNSAASNLVARTYSAALWFSNVDTQVQLSRVATLQIVPALQVSPSSFTVAGPIAGPFMPAQTTLTLSNFSTADLNWSLGNTSAWFTASINAGTLAAGGPPAIVSLSLTPAAAALPAGVYRSTLIFSNLTNRALQPVRTMLDVGQNMVINGGFEDGDFTGWDLVGDTVTGNLFYNGIVNADMFDGASAFIHSGNYGAALGESGYLATLSQTLSTCVSGYYLVSFWVSNPSSLTTEQLQLNWNGITIYNIYNPASFAWTNLQFVVTATGSSSILQFAAQNDQDYFGLDDVSVVPLPQLGFASVATAADGISPQFSWATAPGLVYQLQYKTNLQQSGWINLGPSITAGTNVLTVIDTNAFQFSPQRFYRLEALP